MAVNICELQTLESLCGTVTNGFMTLSCRIETETSAVANSYYGSAKTFSATIVFAMKKCENSVMSDRFAILSTVCNLEFRFESTHLEHSGYSYSTCILALPVRNVWPDEIERVSVC